MFETDAGPTEWWGLCEGNLSQPWVAGLSVRVDLVVLTSAGKPGLADQVLIPCWGLKSM